MGTEAPSILYLTYHGLASPLGRAQCVPYLLRLAAQGRARIHVISFESDPLPDDRLRKTLREAGIGWDELRYHGWPKGFAKMYDIATGLTTALRVLRARHVDVVHARSYVMGAVALLLRRLAAVPYVFDMLGMLADEYADVGHWSREGIFYRVTKAAERVLLGEASAVIVLTQRNATYLRAFGLVPVRVPVSIVPCCVDLERFRCADASSGYPRGGAPLLVYAGSLGTWYMLDEMLDFLAAARHVTPDLRLRLLTRSDRRLVDAALARRPVPPESVEVIAAHPDEVPGMLCEADAALAFIRPTFSKHAASPTKLAEYLACGLPVIATRGVGDVDALLASNSAGVLLDGLDEGAYREAWSSLANALRGDAAALRARCRNVAERQLAAERAVDEYARVYESVRTEGAAA